MNHLWVVMPLIIMVIGCGQNLDNTNQNLATANQDSLSAQFALPSQSELSRACDDNQACKTQLIVNKIREDNNLEVLATSIECQEAAQFHAEDMAENNYFSHTSQDGSSPRDRALRFNGLFSGENIAYGQQGAELVTTAWMNSKGHRENILLPSHTKTGIGYAPDRDNRPYWVQVFCN